MTKPSWHQPRLTQDAFLRLTMSATWDQKSHKLFFDFSVVDMEVEGDEGLIELEAHSWVSDRSVEIIQEQMTAHLKRFHDEYVEPF